MSSDEQEDAITILSPTPSEYAASEPGCSPQRIKTGKSARYQKQKTSNMMTTIT